MTVEGRAEAAEQPVVDVGEEEIPPAEIPFEGVQGAPEVIGISLVIPYELVGEREELESAPVGAREVRVEGVDVLSPHELEVSLERTFIVAVDDIADLQVLRP